jgi:hypothetical protein
LDSVHASALGLLGVEEVEGLADDELFGADDALSFVFVVAIGFVVEERELGS